MVVTSKSPPLKVGWVESWKEESGVELAWMLVVMIAAGVTYEAYGLCAKPCVLTWRTQQDAKLVGSRDTEPVDMDFGPCRSPGANPHGYTRGGCIKVHYWNTLHRIFGLILKFLQHIFPKKKKISEHFLVSKNRG